MKKYLYSVLEGSGTLTTEEIVLHIAAAVLLGLVIYLSYYMTHAGGVYSKKFNVSLLTLTVLTATVMTVIGNNIALSLGMVGALSIVRFRTAIKDSRDTTYIFWTIIVGICCGVGDYLVASLKSDEFCQIPYSLSQDWIAEFEDKIDDIKRKPTFQNSVFKEYDRVMIVVEKDKYSAYGVHKGAVGTIMSDYSINDKWYVIFSDEHGEDYADIEVSEKDMAIVNNQN